MIFEKSALKCAWCIFWPKTRPFLIEFKLVIAVTVIAFVSGFVIIIVSYSRSLVLFHSFP